jgi:hypothetical protein
MRETLAVIHRLSALVVDIVLVAIATNGATLVSKAPSSGAP